MGRVLLYIVDMFLTFSQEYKLLGVVRDFKIILLQYWNSRFFLEMMHALAVLLHTTQVPILNVKHTLEEIFTKIHNNT